MPIISTNFNPKNDTKYARRRSVWKGDSNQLRVEVENLRRGQGITAHVYLMPATDLIPQFSEEWNVILGSVSRTRAKGLRQPTGSWVVKSMISQKMYRAVPPGLRGDLELIWTDFQVAVLKRFHTDKFSSDPDGDENFLINQDSLLVFAPGTVSFDLILSKYGYGDNQRKNHKFYHWQARLTGVEDMVHVDNYF
jgi:hypothetical protein